MNEGSAKAHENLQTNSSEQVSKLEVCEHCNGELTELMGDIDQSTLHSEKAADRLKYLNVFAEKSGLPPSAQAADQLHDYELNRSNSEANFDITQLPIEKLQRIIQRANRKREKLDSAETTEKSEQTYEECIGQLKQSGKSNTEIIQILVIDPATPESEKAKLQAFSKIIALATEPSDQQLISQKVNSLDTSKLPDPVTFIQHQVFDTPEQKSGFSKTFQESIAQAYNIPRMRNATVSDMENNLDAKVPIVDRKTGEVTGYKPAITRENAPEVRPGIIMYVNEDGQKTYETLSTGETFPFRGGVAGNHIDKMKLQFLGGRDNWINDGIENIFGLNLKNAHMPKDHELEKIHEIQNAILGGSQNLSAEVMFGHQQKTFSQRLLFLSQFGEATPFSHSSEQMTKSWQQLGLINSADPLDVNLKRLKAAGDWLNAHPNVSGTFAFKELRKYLET